MTEPIIFDITINFSTLESDIFPLIHKIRPQWSLSNTQFKLFPEGNTNIIIGLFQIDPYSKQIINESDGLIIKLFGQNSDLFIDRQIELNTLKELSKYDLSNKIFCQFHNGLIYSYRPGEACTREQIADKHISKLIAKKLAQYHLLLLEKITNEQNPKSYLIPTMKKFLNLLNDDSDFRIDSYTCSNLLSDIEHIESIILPKLNFDVVYCHNDLICKNVIYDRSTDDVSFIDFEYAMYNYWIYDIANHFIEYAGVEQPDFNLYPNIEHQKQFLQTYFYYRKLTNIDNDYLNNICDLIDKFAALSHLFWSLWAFVQAKISKIDFNYKEYGYMRFKKYFDFKTKLFE